MSAAGPENFWPGSQEKQPFAQTLEQEHTMTDLRSVNPVWNAPRESSDRSVNITPCDPIEMRLLDVRIPWEPSSFVEDSDRKNIYS